MTTRRSLLRMIGLAPAAAISSKVDPAMVGLTSGMSTLHTDEPPPAGIYGNAVSQTGSSTEQAYRAWRLVNNKAIPDHKREQLIGDAARVTYLDPDLACLRSYSLSAKMQIQKQRNIARRLESMEKEIERRFASEAFEKAFRFNIY